MADNVTLIEGRVAGISEADAARLSVIAVRGNTVLATSPLRADGSYRLHLSHAAARASSAYAVQVAVLPSTAAALPDRVRNAPRAAIKREALAGDKAIQAPGLSVNAALLDAWSIFWREWCVSGTVVGPDGCAAPVATVTVYTVSWTSIGYHKYARASVTTGVDGTFTLCFPWWDLLLPCWPCEPFWWHCWPWWWEADILHVIEALEARASKGAHSVALFRPEGHALIRGQGFANAVGALRPDPARTALIARKLANPTLRELFPWWWWCCREPNIIFSVTQNGTTILAEDPALDTRWCMDSGQSVTLTGNSSTLSYCPGGTLPESGMVWTSVGTILTSSIDAGGLAQNGGDNSDVAFQGSLWLYAAIAPGSLAYYQVNGAVWNAPQFRGGSKPAALPAGAAAANPIAAPLWLPVWIFDPATSTATFHNVLMGPFSANGYVNLYATPDARRTQTQPTLPPFPTVPPNGQVFWGYEGLVLTAADTTLLGGIPFGAVDLTLVGFDTGFNPVAVSPDDALTLTIDSTPVMQSVGTITAWSAPSVPATNTGSGECPAYDVGPTGFVQIPVTVTDSNGFLCQYELQSQYGHGNAPAVSPPGTRGYQSNPLVLSPSNPDYAKKSWVGGTEIITFPTQPGPLPPDCCYEFRLYFNKRVTNGNYWPANQLSEGDFQTINLKFSS